MTAWALMIIAVAVASSTMSLLWLWQRKTGTASMVDVAWCFAVGSLGVFFAFGASSGLLSRRILVALLISGWALRLGSHVLHRVLTSPEDGRYDAFKEKWGEDAQRQLFFFYQAQAGGAVLFALPALLSVQGTEPLGWLDLAGVIIWATALSGEWIADRQLARFKGNEANRGQVCDIGLWRYSRHPNYFFEWLHWWTYVAIGLTAPWGWLAIFAPLTMLYFILCKTGIPPTEEQALKSRGEAYRQYQRTTSAFFPWFPKRKAT